MKKAAGHISVILRGILFIGFSIQIVLGLIWMCFNFAHLQEFEQASGILYRGLRRLTGGHYRILYVLQLGAGYYAAHRFLQRLYPVRRCWNIWGSLALLTFPMAMQCHLAVSPYSLVSSLVLLELSASLDVVRKKEDGIVREFVRGGFFWLLLALLLPEYFILGAVPLALALLFRLPVLVRQLYRLGLTLAVLAAFGGMIAGINTLAGETEYLSGRETIAFSLFDRMAWPTLWPDSADWPEEVRAVVGDDAWTTSQYPDNMQSILRPIMQESFDDAQAVKYYLEMAAYSWKRHTPLIIRQIGGDALGYVVTPLILPMQLRGEAYASYSGRNYEYMFIQTPVLTKYYMNYSCWWFGGMLALTVLLTLIRWAGHSRGISRQGIMMIVLCLLWAGITAALYTLRGAGVMDYKCTVAVNLLWLIWAVMLMRKDDSAESGEGGHSEKAERKNI